MVNISRRAALSGLFAGSALALGACSGGLGSMSFLNSEPAEAPPEAGPPNPKLEDLMQAGPLGERTIGKAGAPVTIIQYVSLTCPVCSAFHKTVFPQLKKTYIDKGKVLYIHREFPIGRASATAALAARCAPEKQYFKLNERFLTRQPEWVSQEIKHDAIYNLVKDAGVKRAEFDACLTNQTINDGLVWVKQRGRSFGVVATPTFFINGQRMRGGLSMEELQKAIDPLLAAPPAPAQAQASGRPA